jgi:hypothetical protein
MRRIPPIAFLGIAERAAQIADGPTPLLKYNIQGLKDVALTHILPATFSSVRLVFAIYVPLEAPAFRVRIVDDNRELAGTLDLQLSRTDIQQPKPVHTAIRAEGPLLRSPEHGWMFAVLPPGDFGVVFRRPGPYRFLIEQEGQELVVGTLQLAVVDPLPLTPERIAAIRSDPNSSKFVRMEMSCTKCGSRVRAYVGVERAPNLEAEGYVWFESLPVSAVCNCGTTTWDLSVIRRNLHGLLESSRDMQGQVSAFPLYERSALSALRTKFAALLEQEVPEETFQKFIEENPVLLHAFSPQQVFFKAPVLSLRKTDFAILNHQRELILIEIERPNTKLMKKDGGVHSELQHAFDQARQWLHVSDEQRLAVLDCVGVERGSVGVIRAFVIAGRAGSYERDHLRQLQGTDFGRIGFRTYDDLLAGLDVLIRSFESL